MYFSRKVGTGIKVTVLTGTGVLFFLHVLLNVRISISEVQSIVTCIALCAHQGCRIFSKSKQKILYFGLVFPPTDVSVISQKKENKYLLKFKIYYFWVESYYRINLRGAWQNCSFDPDNETVWIQSCMFRYSASISFRTYTNVFNCEIKKTCKWLLT